MFTSFHLRSSHLRPFLRRLQRSPADNPRRQTLYFVVNLFFLSTFFISTAFASNATPSPKAAFSLPSSHFIFKKSAIVAGDELPLRLLPLHQLTKKLQISPALASLVPTEVDLFEAASPSAKTNMLWTSTLLPKKEFRSVSDENSSDQPALLGARVPRLKDDGRVFWYAMGASALASLATRFLSIGPGIFALAGIAVLGMSSPVPPLITVIIVGALLAGYLTVDAAIAALAGSFVFDSVSKYYRSHFLSGFMGQMLGNALAVSAVGLMVGFGLFYTTGIDAMAQFLAADFSQAVSVFSSIGLMPVAIVGLFVSIALPAIAGAWGLSISASPAKGFGVDPSWKIKEKRGVNKRADDADRRRQMRPEHRKKVRTNTQFSFAIPGT
ncbi:MAG: hypothetical protein GY822_22620 [Deltaproteobacteria bacterium]|nr:hypothetical protein [Deltaproteobacteria bacterium]